MHHDTMKFTLFFFLWEHWISLLLGTWWTVFLPSCVSVCGFSFSLEDYGERIWDNNLGSLRVACELVSLMGCSHTVPRQHSQPLPLHQVKGECLFSCNLPPALLPKPPPFNTVPKILGSCFCPEWGVWGKVLLLYHGVDGWRGHTCTVYT